VLLLPGVYLECVNVFSPSDGLHIVELQEREPPFPVLEGIDKYLPQ
jgi:hypothetical protein